MKRILVLAMLGLGGADVIDATEMALHGKATPGHTTPRRNRESDEVVTRYTRTPRYSTHATRFVP